MHIKIFVFLIFIYCAVVSLVSSDVLPDDLVEQQLNFSDQQFGFNFVITLEGNVQTHVLQLTKLSIHFEYW